MKQFRKILMIVACHVIGFIVIIIIGGILGLRIVFDPTIIIDWGAVTAIGTWCTAIVPIFLVFLTVYVTDIVEKERKNVVQSNLHLYEAINRKGQSNEFDEEDILQRILDYVRIGLVCTTEEISKFIGQDISTTLRLLLALKSKEKIEVIGGSKQISDKLQTWKAKDIKVTLK